MIFFRRPISSLPFLLVGTGLFFAGCALRPKPRYFDQQKARKSAKGPQLHQSEGSLTNGFFSLPYDPRHEKLAASIRVFLDARYKLGGQDANAADCSGFVKAVFQEAYGKRLPRKAEQMYRLGTPIAQPSLRAGDLVFFSHPENGAVNHVGIYLSEKKFVHSTVSQGVTVSSLADAYWQQRYAGGRRL